MAPDHPVLRRWGFPAAGAVAVGVLIAVNLPGLGPTPSVGAPGLSPAPPAPVLRSPAGTSAADDHYRACRTEAPTWDTTAARRNVFTYQLTFEVEVGLSATEVTVDPVLTLRSTVTRGSGDPTPSDAEVLAAVRQQHRLRLAAAGSATASDSRRVALPDGTRSKDRIYSVYSGQVAWSGRWTYRWCADHFWHTAGGRWTSFTPTRVDGVALCRLDGRSLLARYPSSSWDHQACQGT